MAGDASSQGWAPENFRDSHCDMAGMALIGGHYGDSGSFGGGIEGHHEFVAVIVGIVRLTNPKP